MVGRFSITVTSDYTGQVNPLWDDKLKIVKEREQGEQFFRTKIEGTISFVNRDFDLMESSSLETQFEVAVVDNQSNQTIASGMFYKTDVEFDYDNKIASTKISTVDEYSAILDHMEDEIDVLSLGLPVHPLNLDKRAILQLYILGDTKLTNVVGNQSYEVDAITGAESMTGAQVSVKQFQGVGGYYEFNLTPTDRAQGVIAEALRGTFKGYYYGTNSSENKFWRSDGEYYFAMYGTSGYTGWHTLFDKNGNLVTGLSDPYQIFVFNAVDVPEREITIYDSNLYDLSYLGYAYATGHASLYNLYARILTDKQTDWLEKDNVFTSSDVLNYRYVTKPSQPILNILKDSYVWSDSKIPEPTKWGVASDGGYFTRPATPQNGITIPVGWIRWSNLSFWVQLGPSRLVSLLSMWDSTWTLNDAYPLFDVIQKMLDYWEIPIIVMDSSACSKFFSGNSSETSEIRSLLPMHNRQSMYITPITNLEKTFYDTAARKMTLSLQNVFQMLKGCFNVYWDIKKDGAGNILLRLEHLSFYELGLTYDNTQQNILVDTDNLIHPLLGKPWAFGQSKATYEVSDLASRYEFRWPTECTDVFDGFAIQVENGYVEANSKEEISIPRFFSDVDLVMSTPDTFSDDSIALLGSGDDESVTRQQLGPLNGIPQLPTFFTQNGYLSLLYLELTYHRWALSGNHIHAEDFPGSDTAQKGSMIAQTVERFRHQTIRIPMSPSILTSPGNIKTPLGVGIPQKISYELDSCIAEIELLQEN